MGPRFLIDTSTIIDFLTGNLPANGASWLIEKVNSQEHCICPIVQIEVLGYKGGKEDLQTAEAFIAGSCSLPIDDRVVAHTILIRKKKKIKLPDAIIAATAVAHNLKVVSRNEKDFEGLDGVEVINLHKL